MKRKMHLESIAAEKEKKRILDQNEEFKKQ